MILETYKQIKGLDKIRILKYISRKKMGNIYKGIEVCDIHKIELHMSINKCCRLAFFVFIAIWNNVMAHDSQLRYDAN